MLKMHWTPDISGYCLLLVVGFLTCGVLTSESSQGYKTYKGDKVLEVQVPDKQTWTIIQNILVTDMNYQDVDIWRHPEYPKRPTADIYVTSADYANVARDFVTNGIQFEDKIDDLGKLVEAEHEHIENGAQSRQKRDTESDYNILGIYPKYDEIHKWLEHLEKTYPFVSLVNLGQTHENRTMTALKIGLEGANKSSIWLDAGIHSREYISVTTAIFIADQLIQGHETGDSQVTGYLETFDFYILPVVNPDGFVYCHEHERLWRKNRGPTPDPNCTGVDLNRNWDSMWGSAISEVDKDPCGITFRGPSHTSEPEVKNIANFLLNEEKDFIAFITLHSYSQTFFTRYAYDYTSPPEHDELLSVAEMAAANMFLSHGTVYLAGTAPSLLYPFAGGSADWAYDKANVTYSYLLELRDRGMFGFLLPAENIIPTGEETWAGMKVVFDTAKAKFENPDYRTPGLSPRSKPITSGNDVTHTGTVLMLTAMLCIWLVKVT